MTNKAKANFEWVTCPECNHKLFKWDKGKDDFRLEIKCSSCKTIVNVLVFGGRIITEAKD